MLCADIPFHSQKDIKAGIYNTEVSAQQSTGCAAGGGVGSGTGAVLILLLVIKLSSAVAQKSPTHPRLSADARDLLSKILVVDPRRYLKLTPSTLRSTHLRNYSVNSQ